MKKTSKIFLYMIGFVLLFFISVLSMILIRRNQEDQVVKDFRKSLYKNEENDMPIVADDLVIGAIVVLACGAVIAGGVTVGYLIKHREEKVHEIDDSYRANGLKAMSDQCHAEIRKLSKVHKFIQKNCEKMFQDAIDLRNMERMYMLSSSRALQEKEKKKLDKFDRFINKVDVFNRIKSKEQKLRENANDAQQSKAVIERNEKEADELTKQIAGMRKIISQNQKEIQKALNNLEKLYESVQNHIKCFEEKRTEFIENKLKTTSEPHLTYESKNYIEVQFTVLKMLGESRDENGKVSAEILCGFVKVFEQMVYQGREYSLVNQGNTIQETLYDEEKALRDMKEKVKFPFFDDLMRIDEAPRDYDPNQPALLYSRQEVREAIKYLDDKKRIFGNTRKTQLSLEGKMDVINECAFNLEENIRRIEYRLEERKNGKVNLDSFKEYAKSGQEYLSEITKPFRFSSATSSSVGFSLD
jgi:hypothetical protein